MIYLLFGDDIKIKNNYIKEIIKDNEALFLPQNNLNKDLILSYVNNGNLFGNLSMVIVENILKDENINFSDQELIDLKNSKNIFILKEDKLLVSEQKKYNKYAEIQNFEIKKIQQNEKFNIFSLTDAFSKKDKINSWTLYIKAIDSGIEPEAIVGVLFWKIKMMIQNGSRIFNKEDLKKQSSLILSIYHKAHRGELDLNIAIEKFILNSLSSK